MRILLLSYCFPPVPLIEAQVTAKISAHLDAEIDVVAASPQLWRLAADHSLDGFIEERFSSVTRVSRPGAPLLVAAQGRLPLLGATPDALTYLNRRVRAALARIDLQRYDLLVTRSQFHSIHLVPLTLRRRPPWVAHFSDPWVNNPSRREGAAGAAINRARERRVLSAADRLVFTSADAAAFTLADHAPALAAKARHVPHCFVPELYAAAQTPASQAGDLRGRPLLARHVGHLRWNRHPEPLLRAIRAAVDADPGLAARLSVELIGLIGPGMLESATARALPPGLLVSRPPVDYAASLAAMGDADLLLVTESVGTKGIDLHAKIVDYAGAGVPIVGIAPPGPTTALIGELGGWHAPPDQPDLGAQALLRGLAEAERRRTGGAPGPWGDPAARERFSAATVGARLAEIYAECVSEAGRPGATTT